MCTYSILDLSFFIDGLKKWYVKHGGNGLDVEIPPIGSDLIPEEAGLPTNHCFVSSFAPCTRTQFIKLKNYNLQPWMMDILQPKIEVSEWLVENPDFIK